MRLTATALVAVLCSTTLAAPAPFLESTVPEAVLETGSKERTEAFLRWLKAADLAQAILPGQVALPAGFSGKLKAVPQAGFRVVLKLQGGARAEERALFEKLVGKVTARAGGGVMADRRTAEVQLEQQMLVRKMLIVRRAGGRAGRFGGGEMALGRYLKQIQDQEIRANPPRLVAGPARR